MRTQVVQRVVGPADVEDADEATVHDGHPGAALRDVADAGDGAILRHAVPSQRAPSTVGPTPNSRSFCVSPDGVSGLVQKASARLTPGGASSTRLALNMTTTVAAWAGSARTCCSTSTPDTSGRCRSSSTTSGRNEAAA